MGEAREINRGYIDYQRFAAPAAEAKPSWVVQARNRLATSWLARRLSPVVPYLVVTAMFVMAAAIFVYLRLATRRVPLGAVHKGALDRVDLFKEQYPFHFYPLLVKALELTFLQAELAKVASPSSKIVEIAIGDGTLSRQIYPAGTKITGVDISPFSLRLPAKMPQVERAIISDCLEPPLASGTFDLLVSNNFLHHISDKRRVLEHFARIAARSIFNENSTYWASAWPGPFILGRLGFKQKEARLSAALATRFLQDLRPRSEVDAMVSERFDVDAKAEYLCEKTYFLCNLFANFMGVYGPPTPAFMKRLASGRLRNPILWLTGTMARALIRYDNCQDKQTAAFISYSCQSKSFQRAEGGDLLCPSCKTRLDDASRCENCAVEYPSLDGMVFLVPPDLKFILENYVARRDGLVYEKESMQQHH